jgi:hypothetical protein
VEETLDLAEKVWYDVSLGEKDRDSTRILPGKSRRIY